MTLPEPLIHLLLLLGLAFFFGLAFEEFHAQGGQVRPGGVRTFPLLALSGALLYQLDTTDALTNSVSVALILAAASTNNLAKAAYVAVFAGRRVAMAPAGSLTLLALSGGGAAWWLATT